MTAEMPDLNDRDQYPGMVHWFSPKVLLSTVQKVIASTIFAQYADRRLVHAALDSPIDDETLKARSAVTGGVFAGKDTIWLDYVADIADGFFSTYSIAYLIGQKRLVVGGETLPRADCLIMGGDEVYPDASREAYRLRMERPYQYAFPDSRDREAVHPLLYLIPGNHDWYDGLTLFLAKFCRGKPTPFGSWRAVQNRSYFAVHLGHNWWVWGYDSQLGEDIDKPQAEYFERISALMPPNAKVIICASVPTWLHAEMKHPKKDEKHSESIAQQAGAPKAIKFLEKVKKALPKWARKRWKRYLHKKEEQAAEHRRKFYRGLSFIAAKVEKCEGATIPLVLSGDLHHYSRYKASASGTNFITAGGGGAFLHPTHHLQDKIHFAWIKKGQDLDLCRKPGADPKTTQECCYPSRETSRNLAWGNWKFAWRNLDFSVTLGFFYWLAGLVALAGNGYGTAPPYEFGLQQFWEQFLLIVSSPAALIAALPFLGAISHYADFSNKITRVLVGGFHALLQALIMLLATTLVSIAAYPAFTDIGELAYFLLLLAIIPFGFVGGVVWGIYLICASWFWASHANDAFSAMRLDSYRHFLRMKIEKDRLTIFPIGLDKAIQSEGWRPVDRTDSKNQDTPFLEPVERIQPRLIEEPICINANQVTKLL